MTGLNMEEETNQEAYNPLIIMGDLFDLEKRREGNLFTAKGLVSTLGVTYDIGFGIMRKDIDFAWTNPNYYRTKIGEIKDITEDKFRKMVRGMVIEDITRFLFWRPGEKFPDLYELTSGNPSIVKNQRYLIGTLKEVSEDFTPEKINSILNEFKHLFI